MDAKQLLFNTVYVVMMHKYGESEGHIYVLGVFDNLELAKKEAEEHKQYRSNKYEWVIQAFDINNKGRSKTGHNIAKSENMNVFIDDELKDVSEFIKINQAEGKTLGEIYQLWIEKGDDEGKGL